MNRKQLVYTPRMDLPDEVVFATPARARTISKLHQAIADSRTWAEFRAAVPKDEFAELLELMDEHESDVPKDTDPFVPDTIPGYSECGYPPWLQAEMHEALPPEIVGQCGEWVATTLDGSYVRIDASNLTAAIRLLEELGFEVQDGSHYGMWY